MGKRLSQFYSTRLRKSNCRHWHHCVVRRSSLQKHRWADNGGIICYCWSNNKLDQHPHSLSASAASGQNCVGRRLEWGFVLLRFMMMKFDTTNIRVDPIEDEVWFASILFIASALKGVFLIQKQVCPTVKPQFTPQGCDFAVLTSFSIILFRMLLSDYNCYYVI